MAGADRFRYLEAAAAGADRPRGTLVLIHAFPVNARMWRAQLVLAERGWRVIAPHLRGFGEGGDDRPVASIDDYAGDVIDLLDALHVHEAVIGGVSMGGYVSLAMFRHAPRYFQGLVLADTRAEADTPEAAAGRTRMLELVTSKGPASLAQIADEMVPKLLGATTLAQRAVIVDQVRTMILSNTGGAIAGAIRALVSRPDSTSLLSKVRCPTLIIVGDEDTVTPKPLSERMQHAIPHSELVTVPSAGHLSSLEQPEAFNAALARFLDHRL